MVYKDWTRIKKVGDSFMIRIPARVFKDKEFPFVESEDLVVEIKGTRLEVRKEM